jgi:hypothetical protein
VAAYSDVFHLICSHIFYGLRVTKPKKHGFENGTGEGNFRKFIFPAPRLNMQMKNLKGMMNKIHSGSNVTKTAL